METSETVGVHSKLQKRVLFKLWSLLILCITFYGFGIFIVYIPNELYGISFENSYIELTIGRLLGIIFVIISTTKFSTIYKFNENIQDKTKVRANIFSVVSPMSSTLGYVTYNILVKRGCNLSIVSTLTNLYIVIPVIYGIFVLHNKMSIYKYIGFPCMIISVSMIGLGVNSNNKVSLEYQDVLLIISTILLWGCSAVIRMYSIQKIGYTHFMYLTFIGQTITTLFILIIPVNMNIWSLVVISGHFIISLGNICSIIISSDLEGSKWISLSQLSVIITLIMSLIVFKEPISTLTTIGAVFLVLSGILVSF